eukprot:CAMPEP_0183769032 /NCGR_PEP_ID=MMETSP0739-20130205/20402_1 /TAXON_ID=385413 /ORGANISM="Thalassiosira miniscula, Strain CCMP1093" /LENGTH=269 /DNA_ID=CAMNT_0026008505 /DNA_START=77 /DNA_END=883 /DNA_ORIENTATION=+
MNTSIPVVAQLPNASEASRPQEHPTTEEKPVIDALQERIAFLERELVDARLQLACSKASEDHLKLQLSRMKSGTTNAKTMDVDCRAARIDDCDSSQENIVQNSQQFYIATGDPVVKDSPQGNIQENLQQIYIPTGAPVFRKKVDRVHRARRMSSKTLNKNSCASGLNLLTLSQKESSGSLMSRCFSKRSALNPNSCASGLNLLDGAGIDSVGSMSELLRSSGLSNTSLSFLGSARLLSSSSLRRGGSSRNNMRLGSRNIRCNGRGNAEW